MSDVIAIVRLPDPATAPAFRQSLSALSHFSVEDFGDGIVAVAPAEGSGGISQHFSLVRLADASSDLADPGLLAVLRERPPHIRSDVDPDAYLAEMQRRAMEIRNRVPGVQGALVALALTAFGAAQKGELDQLVRTQLPAMFEPFPSGSLWYVEVADSLLARLAFARSQLAMSLLNDLPVGEDMDRLSSLEGLTLTKGIDMSAAINVALLLLSPAVLGFLIPAAPHVLVFCFGAGVELRVPYPSSLASLYRPRVLHDPEGLSQPDFLGAQEAVDGEGLLAWWVDRLNVIYSHATDPTRFTTQDGYYDAPAQTAWIITVERLLGDLTSLLAEPQATELDRVQVAFDLLDKAEALLGYGRDRSPKGFLALLRRGRAIDMMTAAYQSMPERLADRFTKEAARLFDVVYDEILGNAVTYRRRPKGVDVAGRDGALTMLDEDTYVSRLVRAVRNSSHGLLDVLREHEDRHLLATNTGDIPAEFPALAAFIGIALIADAEGLIDGSTRQRLTAQYTA